MTAPVRPLINSAPVSEFGDLREQAQFYDPNGQDRDGTYVPGFSEMRRERDIQLGQYARGQIAGQDVRTLPVNLRWGRNQLKDGKPDSSKLFSHGRLGYRLVTKEDLGKEWLKETPGGAQWDAAGNLRNGDTVLMVAEQAAAAKNAFNKAVRTEERVTGVLNSFSAEVAKSGVRAKGVDPTITKLPPGQPIGSA